MQEMNFGGNKWELLAMLLYLALVIGVGLYFFFKGSKNQG